MARTLWNRSWGPALFLCLCVPAAAQTTYTWVQTAGGDWSVSANWSPSAPPAGGSDSIRIDFNAAATFTANNDLAGEFHLHRLLFLSGTPTVSGNTLVLTNFGTTFPAISNSAAITSRILNPIALGTNTLVGSISGGTILLAGDISGAGSLTNGGAGAIVITGNNTYSGLTVVMATGAGAWQGVVLSNTTGGTAIPGHINLGGGGGNNVYLRLGADEQIADTAVLTFDTSANHGRFILNGRTETIAGLQSTSGRGIAENTDQNDPYTTIGPATLILKPGAGEVYTFNGYLRNAFTFSNSNLLYVVKQGAGTQILGGGNIGNSGGGGLGGVRVEQGVLVFTNTTHSNFTAPIAIEGGKVVIATDTALWRTRVTNNVAGGLAIGGTLANVTIGSLNGNGDLGLTNAAGGAATLVVGSNNYSGVYSGNLSGAGALWKVQSGEQVLSGSNTYSGGTIVYGGILRATKADALAQYNTAGKVDVRNGATLAVNAGGVGEWSGADIGALVANASWAAGSRLGLYVESGTVEISSAMSGSFGLHKLGGGTLTLSGANSYSGGTVLQNGVLSIGQAAHLPTAGTLVFTGGTLRVTGTSLGSLDAWTLNTTTFRGGIEVDDASHTLGLNASLGGNGWLVKSGAGTLTIGTAGTFAGSVTNLAGMLRFGASAPWYSSAALHLEGGTVDLGPNFAAMGSLSGAGGTVISNAAGLAVTQAVSAVFAGEIAGAGGFVKAGGGILVLAGENTYTGLTVVNSGAGALVLSNTAGRAIAGDLQIGSGGNAQSYVRLEADEQIADTAIVSFSAGGFPNFGRWLLLGRTETVGGLHDPNGRGIVENSDNTGVFPNDDGAVGPATLILSNTTDRVFAGYLRNYGSLVSSPLGLTVRGSARQTLSGSQITYSGPTRIESGELALSNTTSFASDVFVTGGRLVLQDGSGSFNSRQLTNNAAGGLAFEGNTNFVIGGLSGTGSFALTNRAGQAVTLSVGGGDRSGTWSGLMSGSGGLTKVGTSVQVLASSNSYDGLTTVQGGVLRVDHPHGLGSTLAGTVILGDGSYLQLGNGVTVTGETIEISGGGNNFGALQTVAGGTATWAGTVQLGPTQLASYKPRLGAGPGGTLVIAGDVVGADGRSNLYISGEAGTGRVVLSGTNNAYNGMTGVIRGWLVLGRNHALPPAAELVLNVAAVTDPSVVDLNGFDQAVAGLRTFGLNALSLVTNTAAGTPTLTVNLDAGTNTFTGVLGGQLGLTKAGAGLLVLTGTNTYSGPTVVSNGAVRVQGLHTGGGLITVAGGRLEGNGSVAGAIDVLAGGTLAPGASPGQFTANADVTLQSGAIFEVEINGTTPGTLYDQLLMGGGTTLTLSNPTLSVILGYSPNLGDTFQIVSGFSTLSGSFSGLPTSGSTFTVGSTQFQIDYNTSDITLTVVPEPSSLSLLALVAAVGWLRRRR